MFEASGVDFISLPHLTFLKSRVESLGNLQFLAVLLVIT